MPFNLYCNLINIFLTNNETKFILYVVFRLNKLTNWFRLRIPMEIKVKGDVFRQLLKMTFIWKRRSNIHIVYEKSYLEYGSLHMYLTALYIIFNPCIFLISKQYFHLAIIMKTLYYFFKRPFHRSYRTIPFHQFNEMKGVINEVLLCDHKWRMFFVSLNFVQQR